MNSNLIRLNRNLTLLLDDDVIDDPLPSIYPVVAPKSPAEKRKRNVNFNETVERIQVLEPEADELSSDQKIIFSERL